MKIIKLVGEKLNELRQENVAKKVYEECWPKLSSQTREQIFEEALKHSQEVNSKPKTRRRFNLIQYSSLIEFIFTVKVFILKS